MQTKHGFTKFNPSEFETWFAAQSISRQINTVQHHHTWSPSHKHAARHDAFTLQKNMKHHHVGTNGWSDIGQHFSIFPDGAVLTGRSLNKSPACIYGANRHALCIESVGNFDTGKDSMTPEQSDAIVRVTAAILRRFTGIPRDEHGVVYHHWYDLSTGERKNGAGVTKSCPGTAYFGGNKVADFRTGLLPKLLASLGGAPAPAPALVPQTDYVVVTASALNVRKGPSTDHGKISEHGAIPEGSIMRVHARDSGWLKVANSKEHWVFGRFTAGVERGVINTVDSNCRSGPEMSFPVVSVYQPEQVVYVQERSDGWCRIGSTEWVHGSLITLG